VTQPRLTWSAVKITNPNRQPTLTILLQNQNLFGGWASVDCFRCLNIATSDNNDIKIARFTLTRIRKDNLIKFCPTFRYGLFLRFVFQHLPETNRARLLCVYVVAPGPLLSLLWNNLCDLVHQTASKTNRSQIPAAFGIPGHVITKHLSDTPC